MTVRLPNYLVVEPDGSHRLVSPSYAGIKDGLHDANFDVLSVHNRLGDVEILIDDDGMLKGAALNVPASMFAAMSIYGPVVLVGAPDEEGETTLPPAMVVGAVRDMADRWAAVTFDAAVRKGQIITVTADADRIPPPVVLGLSDEEMEGYAAGDLETRQRIQDRIDLGGDQ